jgi:hypothetical protein
MASRPVAALLFCFSGCALAVGGDFRLNSYTTGAQQLPRVAADPNGGIVVVWLSDGQDGSQNGVFARRYGGGFGTPSGAQFRVNTYTTGQQYSPAVAKDGSGNFVVAWESYHDGDLGGIFAQRYDASGTPLGTEFRVNSSTTNLQFQPDVGMSSAGSFVVVWSTFSPGGTVFLQRYEAGGAPLGGQLQVNTYSGSNYAGRVAVTPAGDFVVVWTNNSGSRDVRARRFSAAGAPLGSDFRVNETSATILTTPAVAVDSAGNFVVAWISDSAGTPANIFARRYSSSGAPLTGEFRVNTYTTGAELRPSVIFVSTGDFVVSWDASNAHDGNGTGVFAQRYSSGGATVGGEFQVNAYTTGGQDSPSVAPDANGGFLVVWRTEGLDGSSSGIAGRDELPPTLFDTDDVRVNTYTTQAQGEGRVAYDAQGNFVVSWTSLGQDGYSGGVFAQAFAAGGAPAGGEFRVNVTTSRNEGASGIAVLPDGGFVVVWQSTSAGFSDVLARRFDASATPLTGDFRVNTYTTSSQGTPVVASGPGGFLVAWASYGQPGANNEDILAQRYDAGGAPLGGECLVNTYTTGQQDFPAVAADGLGDYIVVWESFGQELGSTGPNIFVQRISGGGAPLGGEMKANAFTTSFADEPSVASDATGHFVVAWSAGPGAPDIFARRFAPSGAAEGPEFRVNTYTTGFQSSPTAARSPNGEFVIAWEQSGSYDAIAQRYTRSGAAVGGEFRVNSYTTGDEALTGMAMAANGEFVVIFSSYDASSSGAFRKRYAALLSGDVDGNGVVDVADVFYLINFLFAGGPAQLGEADVNGDYAVDVQDVFYLINFLFAGGAAPK